ncbi:hypothetical protein HXZ87_12555, partial [Myroides sp. R163-1]|nr:hypothetical protein [Myroides sp. R163-1]
MKKITTVLTFFIAIWGAYSQVGIGTRVPNKSAQLTLVAEDRGLLIPNIALKSTTDTETIQHGNVESLLVYSTQKQGDITPGFYYWNKTRWTRIKSDDQEVAPDQNTTNISLTIVDDNLVLTDSGDNTVSIPLKLINTPTTMEYNETTGIITYTNEHGNYQTIDLAQVVHHFETLTSLGMDAAAGSLTYVDERGDSKVLDLANVVKTHETLT